VITFFDADAAGQKAAARAEELLEPSGSGGDWAVTRSGGFDTGTLRVKVALLPPGHDPDTFLRAEGAAAFGERIGAARSLLAYALDRVIGEAPAPAGSRAQLTAFARIALLLAKVPDAQEAAALSSEAARKLGVDPTQLWTESRRLLDALSRPAHVVGTATRLPAVPAPERDLVGLMLGSDSARATLLPLLEDADVTHAALRAILTALRERPDTAAEGLMPDLTDTAARDLLAALLVEERAIADETAATEQFRRRLERSQRLRRMRAIGRSLAEAPQHPGADAAAVDAFRALHRDGAGVYEFAGGSAQSLEPRPQGREGVSSNE
jgi:DNA primase